MRKPPQYIQDLCARFGKSPSGMPWFKFAWADDVLETSFGEVQKRFPEHSGHWLLMKFVPWEDYGPWDYEAFGPKPDGGGEYECSQVIALEGLPVELWELPQDILVKWMYCAQKEMVPHRSEILNGLRDREKKRKQAFSDKFNEIWKDANSVRPDVAISIPGIRPGDQIQDRTAQQRVVLAEDIPPALRAKIFSRGIRQL